MSSRKRIGWLARAGAAGGAASIGALALGFAWSPDARAEQMQEGPRVRMVQAPVGAVRADIVVRQRQVRGDGRLVRAEAPPVALRLDRQMTQGRWRTTYTFQTTGGPRVRSGNSIVPIENPFMVSRVEYDEQTADARAYDRAGRRVALPTDADRLRFGVTAAQRGPGWDPQLFKGTEKGVPGQPGGLVTGDGFFFGAGQRERRRLDIQRRFGGAVGRVRGFDRFLLREEGMTRELLVTPATALPAEINTARAGALASRLQLEYVAAGSLGHVRQALRSERPATSSSADELIVTDLVMANIEVGTGGAR